MYSHPGTALGGAGPNAVLCTTCSVLLCILEQPRADNSSAGSNWLKAGTVHIVTYSYKVLFFLYLLTVEDPCGA